MNEDKVTGVSLGILEDAQGQMYIGVSVDVSQCVLTLHRAMLLFEQLGNILEMLGVIDEDDEDYGKELKCH